MGFIMKNISLMIFWTAIVATLSTSFAVAYIILPSTKGNHHPSHRNSIYTELYTSHGDDSILQTTSSQQSSNILDSISYRQVNANCIPACFRIEFTSYPLDESASIDNLYYRQRVAGNYFWIATLPTHIANEYITKQSTDTDEDTTTIIGFICSTRCNEFIEESMSTHDPNGSILAIHSVVVDEPYRRMGVASAMMQNYLKQMIPFSTYDANTREKGFQRILLLAKAHLLGFYVDNGFMVLRPSPIVHGADTWYELEARQYHLERMIRMQAMNISQDQQQHPSTTSSTRSFDTYSRSTANPDEEIDETLIDGRDQRRNKLHGELTKLGIDPTELESNPERFGTPAVRTYNSFLLPKSKGALAVAESPTRARVVANNISFLMREHKADQEKWLRNIDQNRNAESGDTHKSQSNTKHPIVIVLDNIRSAHNVGNILRLAEASQVKSVRLCGMTPKPPHPKVLKTAMGAAEYVSLGNDDGREEEMSTLDTVRELKTQGYKVYGVETTENATSYDQIKDDDNTPVAYVFGNELIGVDVEVLKECDDIICLPTYGIKNSLNIASCVAIIVWDRLKLINQSYN